VNGLTTLAIELPDVLAEPAPIPVGLRSDRHAVLAPSYPSLSGRSDSLYVPQRPGRDPNADWRGCGGEGRTAPAVPTPEAPREPRCGPGCPVLDAFGAGQLEGLPSI